MKLKERIPDDTTLTVLVEQNIDAYTTEVREQVGLLESDFIKYRLRQRIGLAMLIVAFVGLYTLGEFGVLGSLDEVELAIAFIFFAIFLGYGIWFATKGLSLVKQFHQGVDAVLFEKIFSLLGLKGQLISQPIPKTMMEHIKGLQTHTEMQRTLELLRTSEIITHPYNQTRIDDAFTVEIGDSTLFVSELDLKYRTSGKNSHTIPVFSGFFVSYELDRQLEGKTFITKETDASGFGDSSLLDPKDEQLRVTTLEWNEFEKLFRVTTNNEIEARYVLTTDFMQDLYTWWTTFDAAARISFTGNRMTMVFTQRKIRFGNTIDKISNEKIKEYMLTIAKPLMRVVHLIEDVRL